MEQTNKTLKFSPELVDLVLSGEKTATWRLFDDKDLRVGDVVGLIRRPELTQFAIAEITSVVEKPLGKMTSKDRVGHEAFESEGKMHETYKRYYKRDVNPNTLLKIYRFRLLSRQDR